MGSVKPVEANDIAYNYSSSVDQSNVMVQVKSSSEQEYMEDCIRAIVVSVFFCCFAKIIMSLHLLALFISYKIQNDRSIYSNFFCFHIFILHLLLQNANVPCKISFLTTFSLPPLSFHPNFPNFLGIISTITNEFGASIMSRTITTSVSKWSTCWSPLSIRLLRRCGRMLWIIIASCPFTSLTRWNGWL